MVKKGRGYIVQEYTKVKHSTTIIDTAMPPCYQDHPGPGPSPSLPAGGCLQKREQKAAAWVHDSALVRYRCLKCRQWERWIVHRTSPKVSQLPSGDGAYLELSEALETLAWCHSDYDDSALSL